MSRRLIVLIVALILAGLAAWATWAFLTNVEEDARAELEEVAAFRATEFIDRGALGSDVIDSVEESTELAELLPENAITTQEELEEALVGRVARGPISAGQIVTTDLWADAEDEVAKLSELITPGRQAISIRPDEVRAVGGFMRAGDHVNVLATIDVSRDSLVGFLKSPIGRQILGLDDEFDAYVQAYLDATFETQEEADAFTLEQEEQLIAELVEPLAGTVTVTLTVLQEIDVLAVASVARGETEPFDDPDDPEGELVDPVATLGSELITLEVTPNEAEQLVWIFENARPWLTLISAEGTYEPIATDGVTLADIIGDRIDARTRALLGIVEPAEDQ